MIKKSFSIIIVLSFVVMMSALLPTSYAAQSVMQIECGSTYANPGDTVSLELRVSNNPGFSALNLALKYDKSNIELIGIENRITDFNMYTDSAVIWDGNRDFSLDGTIATATFKLKNNIECGSYQIGINFFEATDFDGQLIPASTSAGEIIVTMGDIGGDEPELPTTDDTLIYFTNATTENGKEATLDLKIKQNTGFSVLNLAVIYDKTKLELLKIENKIPDFVMSADSSVIWDGSGDFDSDGTIATFTFKIGNNVDAQDLSVGINFFEATDYDGNAVTMVSSSGIISVMNKIIVDIDGNGKITEGDARLLAEKITSGNITELDMSAADLNNDGTVDVLDVLKILLYLNR